MKTIPKTRSGGFTLVELVVVLLILAILCAALIPALIGYIDRANETKAVAETRSCVVAAQTLMSENYGMNRPVIPEPSAITALAEVNGVITEGSVEENHAVLNHLIYTNHSYTVIYCRDDATCALHAKTYTVTKENVAAVTEGDSYKAVLEKFPDYNMRLDSIAASNASSKVSQLYNTLDANTREILENKTWCIYNDTGAETHPNCSNKIRFFFTERVYSATESASNVVVYKARLNDDGTLSYQKGICNIVNGKISSVNYLGAWSDDITAL